MLFLRKTLFITVDLILALSAIGLAILIRFEGEIPVNFILGKELFFFSMAIVIICSFYFYGLYEKVWRYAGMHELLNIVSAVSLSLLPYFIYAIVTEGKVYSRSIIVIAWFSTIFFLGGIRFLLRIISQGFSFHKPGLRKRVLIVGANDIGELTLRELQRQVNSTYLPVGFIDDDPSRQNVLIHGVPVLGRRENIPSIIEKRNIDELIISLSSPSIVREIVNHCEKLKVGLKIIPSISEIIDGKIAVNQMREVQIEDLLERAPVKLDANQMSAYIKGKCVLISGAGGSIGSEICRQVAGFGPGQMILLGHGENSIYEIWVELKNRFRDSISLVSFIGDIRDLPRMEELFRRHKPDVVFHAAAHKHVPLMECNSIEAISNNIFGTRNIVDLSEKYGVLRFIFLSTDKAVNPMSIMGTTKRISEIVISSRARNGKTKYMIVRFGNVLGSRGSVIPTFKHQIKMGGPVTVTNEEMARYFMTIPEAVQLVIQAGAMGNGGEIFILDMGKPVKIIDLAKNIIRLSGLELDKDIKIEINGIRPGEKINEELVNSGESLENTDVAKIFKVNTCIVDKNELDKFLADIEEAVREQNEENAKEKLIESIKYFSDIKDPCC